MINHCTHTLNIILDKNTKILILGSFPSVKSRENMFYYMHPRNRFWHVLSNILDIDLINKTIEEKKKILLDNHIGLYDVIEECDIIGSSDSSIKNVIYADIYGFINNSKIEYIFLNGKKASYYFKKGFNDLTNYYELPSTSPANCKYSLEDLINEWNIIKKYL